MKKQRNIQIEIIRILAMLMIILGHAFLYGHAAEGVQGNVQWFSCQDTNLIFL